LPIPQLIAAASTPRVLPSNVSNASNASNASNKSNILAAVSANLVYAGMNTNGSQNITPAASKAASVKSEIEPAAISHEQFMRITSAASEMGANNENDNVVIDILPLTHNNLSIHENSMTQREPLQQQDPYTQVVDIQITELELPLAFDQHNPVPDSDLEGMM
jgi:hypothetical protein